MMTDERTPSASSTGCVRACDACGCGDLFVRKDFPQKVGLAIVVVSAVSFLVLAANPRTFYIGVWVLVGAAAIDAVLYVLVGKVTVCYRCRREFRGVPLNPEHGPFELSIAEKYRQR